MRTPTPDSGFAILAFESSAIARHARTHMVTLGPVLRSISREEDRDLENPYKTPERGDEQAGGPSSQEAEALDLETLAHGDLKKLRDRSHTIMSVGVYWVLQLALVVPASSWIEESSDGLIPAHWTILASFVLLLPGVIGAFHRGAWARVVGMLTCCICLPAFPIGTALGIFGLIAYVGADKLFGRGRVLHRDLNREWKRRKQLRREERRNRKTRTAK